MPVAVYIGLTKKMLLLWALCSLWLYGRSRSRVVAALGPAVLIAMAAWLLIYGVYARPMDQDEVEHLHCAWLVSTGQVPFRDFWQHHSPMMYIAFAPLMDLPLDPIYMPIVARMVGLALTIGLAVICWFIARSLWGPTARLGTYAVVWLAILPLIELFTPRPDLLASVLVLSGLALLTIEGRHATLRYFAGGLLQGFGLSFSPKLYLVLMAPVIASFVYYRFRAIPRLFAFGLGVTAGVVPLAAYLLKHDLLSEFREWVVRFNWKQQVPAGFQFNPVLLGLGLYGAWQLLNRSRRLTGEQRLLFLLAYLFTGLASLQNPLLHIFYYAAPWMILTAVAASAIDIRELLDRANRSRVQLAIAGLAIALALYPGMLTMVGNRSESKEPTASWSTWAKLSRLNRNGTCIALAPFHPIFADDAIGLYGGWQYTFAYLDSRVKDVLTRHGVLSSIEQDRPSTITASTDDQNQQFTDYLLDIKVISAREHERLNRYLADNYTVVQLGRPFYVRNDLLGLARAEGIDVPRTAGSIARDSERERLVAMREPP